MRRLRSKSRAVITKREGLSGTSLSAEAKNPNSIRRKEIAEGAAKLFWQRPDNRRDDIHR
ncbi:uncharacterized protein G2W53_013401 [Senna tora]|uniref:Uncharacterized protein n=1 Tax=Senna tora TaxID=362788 RepID=A0A834TYQ5_9FABA|nr:uncharacterized protein G2W53_013401 [Senna tora]